MITVLKAQREGGYRGVTHFLRPGKQLRLADTPCPTIPNSPIYLDLPEISALD